MKKTQNLRLSLYESNDKFNITANEDSLNHNMELIDESINTLGQRVNSVTSGGLTRQIVETLPSVADGDESIIYMVGPKDDGTYDEYMFIKTNFREYSQGFSSDAPFVDTRMDVTPSLTTFPQEGNTTTLENMKCTARVQIGPTTWGLTFTGEGVTISNPTNDEALYNFVAIDGVYTFKIDHTNGTIIAFKVLAGGRPYELIGTTDIDLPSKQDKFADVSIQAGSNRYILNTDTGVDWTTNIGFKITNTTDMGEISILNATDLDSVKIGSASNPYVVSTYGIYNSKGSPASRVYIDSEQSGLMSNYHGFIATDDISSSIYDNNYSNIVIDKSNENIYLNSNKIIVGTSGMLSSGVNTLGTITNVATPVNGTDAVNKDYVDNNAVIKNSDIIDMSHMESTEINITVTGSSSPPAGLYIVDYFYDLGDNTYSCSIYNAAHQGGFGFTCNDPNFTELATGSTIMLKRNFGQSGEEIIGIPTFVSSRVTNVLTPTADTDAANKSYVDSKAIFKDVGDGSAVTTTKTLIGFANGVTLMGDNIDFNGSEIWLNKDGRTFIKGQSVSIEGDGGLTALSISNNKVEVWGSDVDTLEDIYIPIVGAATPTASSPASQVATKEYVDSVKDHILLKDTATGETYKLCITNGKLSAEVVE